MKGGVRMHLTDTKKNWLSLLLCFFLAFVCITVCSKNSFLYAFNDWVDANAFFTMGKGFVNGLVPYLDLFEQKGPILYLIYGIGYLFSHDSFFGIYLLEIISYTVFLYFSFKIASLYLDKKYAILACSLLGAIIASSTSFVQGGSAEEFCLPLFAISFYSFLTYTNQDKVKPKLLILNGLFAGIVTLIKFNLLGFWFIWMALIFFKTIFQKKYKEAIFSCGYFLLGMFIPIVLTILYFLIVEGLQDFIECYITFNLAYSNQVSLKVRLYQMYQGFKTYFLLDNVLFHLTIFGMIGLVFFRKFSKNIWHILFLVLSFFFLNLGIYYSGTPYIYYYLVSEIYILFGIVFLLWFLNDFFSFKKKSWQVGYFIVLVLFVVCLMFFFLKRSGNIKDMSLEKDNFAQYTFLEVLDNYENPTLLNYDNLDGGFYTTANILPNTKYFMRQNISYEQYPDILDEQNRLIKEQGVDFVIIREYFDNLGYRKNIPYLEENYDMIMSQEQIYEGMEFTYYLYASKELEG